MSSPQRAKGFLCNSRDGFRRHRDAHRRRLRPGADCGAVTGAVENEQLGNLAGLLAKIKPAIEATLYAGERTSRNVAFVDAVACKNVELTLTNIRKGSPVLASMEASGTIKIAGAMYDLKTGSLISSPDDRPRWPLFVEVTPLPSTSRIAHARLGGRVNGNFVF